MNVYFPFGGNGNYYSPVLYKTVHTSLFYKMPIILYNLGDQLF